MCTYISHCFYTPLAAVKEHTVISYKEDEGHLFVVCPLQP